MKVLREQGLGLSWPLLFPWPWDVPSPEELLRRHLENEFENSQFGAGKGDCLVDVCSSRVRPQRRLTEEKLL